MVSWGEDEPHRVGLLRFEPVFLRQDVTVDADGSFVFRGIPPGSYELSVYPSGIFWNNSPIVVKDKDVTVIRRIASPFASVRGSIEIAGGGPVPQLTVRVQRKSGTLLRRIAGPLEGYSEFYILLPAEDLRISLVDVPAAYHVESFLYGDKDFLKGVVRISDSKQSFKLKLSVVRPEHLKRIHGHVLGIERFPDASDVSLWGPSLMTPIKAPIVSDGSYEFSNVPPGTYTLNVANRHRASVELGDNSIQDFDITLPVSRQVRGRVVVDGGGPVPRFDYEFDKVPEDGKYNPDRAPGTFETLLPEGDVRMKFYGFPEIYELQSIKFGETDVLKEPFRVLGTSLPDLVVTLRLTKPTVRVIGRVLPGLSPSNGSSDFRVALYTESQAILMWVTASPDGSFEFPKVPPGIYSLSTVDGYGPLRVTVEDKDIDVGNIQARTR
jgi:hypothetical protein